MRNYASNILDKERINLNNFCINSVILTVAKQLINYHTTFLICILGMKLK